jgi:hypothetical protein
MYEIPMENLRSLKGAKRKLFEDTFDYIKIFFQSWQASNFNRFNRRQIAEAIFNENKRDQLFDQGLIMNTAFNQEAFDLLEKLNENPTKDFYSAHKEEFKAQLEEPFKSLFLKVIEGLPSEIIDVMETEKGLFSRIPKNDYGQGGAWAHYWGAIYPKNGKRVEDGQLYLWINHAYLGYGFHLGEKGGEVHNKFLKNCRQNYKELVKILEPYFTGLDFQLGSNTELSERLDQERDRLLFDTEECFWKEWIRNPDRFEYGISVGLKKDNVLQISEEELIKDIRNVFSKLFPFIFLSLSDDPMPAIKKYLNITRPTIEYSKDDALAEIFITLTQGN